ncbi:ABC transporter permease [Halococcoides cellulosivorans]|uniref:ABC transporter permease n=1 Tax=Halococcoides cellulosivorans TaxID=1679096 RepID=A0A2R4X1D3_9EURY|nr:ABC transporter permease [Halococcoides cellulosivorans]AWB27601.1 ABC transporter permease [Halococcoides cellulosivorans]
MSRTRRIRAESLAALRSFLRRRTAVFFTFVFPIVLIAIFAGLVRTGGAGLFGESPGSYVPAYLAVVVVFTPLSRVASEVVRHREGRRFEKLATTPLGPAEWLLAQTLVTVALVSLGAIAVLVALLGVGSRVPLSPWLVVYVPITTAVFCGLGAIIGSLADDRDGAIAASNGIALPLVLLSETFVASASLPAWFRPAIELSPVTYFARGLRAAGESGAIGWPGSVPASAAVLVVCAVLTLGVAVRVLPWRSTAP